MCQAASWRLSWPKPLAANVEILNLGGASSQVGMTELVTRKADGLTLGQVSLPTLSTVYLQADRKAVFDRKSFEPIAQQSEDGSVIAVKADSPYKTLKDVIDDAKANPNKVTMGSDPWLNFHQLTVAQLEKAAGVSPSLPCSSMARPRSRQPYWEVT